MGPRGGSAHSVFALLEPHHDGTPHWHLLLFLRQKGGVCNGLFSCKQPLKEDGYEPARQEHRLYRYTD